jgi:hypothetical protein
MAKVPNLEALNAAVARAKKARDRPFEPGEGPRPVLLLVALLDERGVRAVWVAVSKILRHRPDLYNEFVSERDLFDQIVDIVAEADAPLVFAELVAAIDARLAEPARWLVAVPLANFIVPGGYLRIQEDVAVLESSVQDPEWTPLGHSDPERDPFAMFHDLKDRLDGGVRWEREGGLRGALDTRMTAKLIVVESGTERAALARATTRARLALATWCLLDSPEDPPDERTLWPSLGEWLPRPYFEAGMVHKPYEPGKWTGTTVPSGRVNTQYEEYTVTDDPPKLSAPFSMMRMAGTMLAPRAVLSGAWQLHLAERQPVEIQRTDELVHLHTAIDALCDIGLGPDDHDTQKRWNAITKRFGVWEELRNVYRAEELDQAQQLGRDLRNITQHGSDDVLVNLGYPKGARREVQGKRELTGEQLSLARASFTVPVLRHGVRAVAHQLADDGIQNGWSDERFAGFFDPFV